MRPFGYQNSFCSRDNWLTFPFMDWFINEGDDAVHVKGIETHFWTVFHICLIQKWNTQKHTHRQMQGFDDLSCEKSPSLPQFLSVKSHHGKKWERQLENRRVETHVRDAKALSPGPPCEWAIAQISQFTGFNELLLPVHHGEWAESTLIVRQRRFSGRL